MAPGLHGSEGVRKGSAGAGVVGPIRAEARSEDAQAARHRPERRGVDHRPE